MICINNYNYFLRTESDDQLGKDFLAEIGDTFDGIANRLYIEMHQNLFIADSDLYISLQEIIAVYKARIDSM